MTRKDAERIAFNLTHQTPGLAREILINAERAVMRTLLIRLTGSEDAYWTLVVEELDK